MMLIYDKVSYLAPYQKPWQSLKRWCESYLNNSCAKFSIASAAGLINPCCSLQRMLA